MSLFLNVYQLLGPTLWDYIMSILSMIPKIMYLIFTTACSVIDLFQFMFRKLLGLDTVYLDGVAYEGDIVYTFLVNILFSDTYPVLKTAFWSMVVLGILLLIIASFVALISSEFNTTGEDKRGEKTTGNAKGKIFKMFFRGLFTMAVFPVATIFGVYIINFVSRAVDESTSVGLTNNVLGSVQEYDSNGAVMNSSFKVNSNGSFCYYDIFGINFETNFVPFSSFIFKTTMFNANRARCDADWFLPEVIYSETGETENVSAHFGVFNQPTTDAGVAALIDEAFACSARLNNEYAGKKLALSKGGMGLLCISSLDPICVDYAIPVNNFSKYRVGLMWYFYDLWRFDIIIGYCAVFILLGLFFNLVFGLLKRIISLIALFIVSPVIAGIAPMDLEGKKYGKFKEYYVQHVITAVATIGAMNLVIMLMPYIAKIQLLPQTTIFAEEGFLALDTAALLNSFFTMMITVAAVAMVKDLVKIISEFFGAGDLASEGKALKDESMTGIRAGLNAAVKTGKLAASVYTGGFAVAARLGKNIGQKKRDKASLAKLKSEADEKDTGEQTDLTNKQTEELNNLSSSQTEEQNQMTNRHTDEIAGLENKALGTEARANREKQIETSAYNRWQAEAGNAGKTLDEFRNVAKYKKYKNDAAKEEIAKLNDETLKHKYGAKYGKDYDSYVAEGGKGSFAEYLNTAAYGDPTVTADLEAMSKGPRNVMDRYQAAVARQYREGGGREADEDFTRARQATEMSNLKKNQETATNEMKTNQKKEMDKLVEDQKARMEKNQVEWTQKAKEMAKNRRKYLNEPLSKIGKNTKDLGGEVWYGIGKVTDLYDRDAARKKAGK